MAPRWVKAVLVAAGGLLLLANGACGLYAAIAADSTAGSYEGLGLALLGLFAFYGAVPLGLLALVLLVTRLSPFAKPWIPAALLVGALAGVALFWSIPALYHPLRVHPRASQLGIVAFGASSIAAVAFLAALRRTRRPPP